MPNLTEQRPWVSIWGGFVSAPFKVDREFRVGVRVDESTNFAKRWECQFSKNGAWTGVESLGRDELGQVLEGLYQTGLVHGRRSGLAEAEAKQPKGFWNRLKWLLGW